MSRWGWKLSGRGNVRGGYVRGRNDQGEMSYTQYVRHVATRGFSATARFHCAFLPKTEQLVHIFYNFTQLN